MLAPEVELDYTEHGWKSMRCPFHSDRAASASYNTTTQRFRCHGCGIAGDGYDIIQEVERCDFATARSRCAGISLVHQDSEVPRTSERSKLTSRRTKSRSRLIRKQRSRLQV